MAFAISSGESAFSEAEKTSLEHLEDKDSATIGAISCQLQLKSSPRLSKQAVLQRIRHRKMLYRIRSAFEGLLGSSTQGNTASALHRRWLEQDDAFSAP